MTTDQRVTYTWENMQVFLEEQQGTCCSRLCKKSPPVHKNILHGGKSTSRLKRTDGSSELVSRHETPTDSLSRVKGENWGFIFTKERWTNRINQLRKGEKWSVRIPLFQSGESLAAYQVFYQHWHVNKTKWIRKVLLDDWRKLKSHQIDFRNRHEVAGGGWKPGKQWKRFIVIHEY